MLYPLNSTPQVQPVKVHKKKNNGKKVNRRQRLWRQGNWKVIRKLKTCISLLTPMSDQDRISPYNINTISSRQVMRIKKSISEGIIS